MLLVNLFVDGIVTGCLYGMVAVGFSLLWWLTGIVHIAHGAVYLVAGYSVFVAATALGLPLWLAIALAVPVAVAAGMAVQLTLYRPFLARSATEDAVITASLGVLIIVQYLMVLAFGPEGVSIDAGLRQALFAGTSLVVDRFAIAAAVSALLSMLALHVLLRRTNLGRSMRAVAENDSLAGVLGLPILRIQLVAHALAAALIVPPAALTLFDIGVHPPEALHLVLMAAVVAILGGRGSVTGAFAGGIIVGVAESVMLWVLSAGWRQLITFSLLYVLLLLRPQGLFGAKGA